MTETGYYIPFTPAAWNVLTEVGLDGIAVFILSESHYARGAYFCGYQKDLKRRWSSGTMSEPLPTPHLPEN